ncbi:hypothetical protein FRB98_005890 [Tulasnella sp. 332]|nr:hypothetical protein FRB98_005890 [Tulasnella sp. 332]
MHPWWTHVHLVLYAGAVVGIGILLAVTYATQGYEPLAILSSDYNTTQRFWYNAFTTRLSPGSLCDPHVFSVGDTFQTSQGTFAWNLDFLTLTESTSSDNPSVKAVDTQGINYIGLPLLPSTCAISDLQVVADVEAWTSTATATVLCNSNSSFPVSSSTSFVSSPFLEKASLNANRLLSPIQQNANVEAQNKWAAQVLLEISGMDILTTLRMNVNPLAASVNTLSVRWMPSATDPLCHTTPVVMEIDTIGFSNGTLLRNDAATELFYTVYWNTTSNFLQTMMAAVNLDIGSPCPSFMTQPSMIPDMLYPTPTLQDTTAFNYYQTLLTAEHTFMNTLQLANAFLELTYGFTFPLYSNDYVYIDASYLCHLSARKSVASLVIAIISATYASFMSGWTVIFGIALFFAPKPINPNYCDGHVVLEAQMKSLPTSPDNTAGASTSLGYFQSMPTQREVDAETPSPKEDAGEKV